MQLQKQNKKKSTLLGSSLNLVLSLLSLNIGLVLGLTIFLSGCSNVPVADVPVFTELAEDRAYYIYTISNKEGFVDDYDKLFFDEMLAPTPLKWSEIKPHSLYLPSFSWAKLEAMILKLCAKQKQNCDANGNPEEKIKKLHSIMANFK